MLRRNFKLLVIGSCVCVSAGIYKSTKSFEHSNVDDITIDHNVSEYEYLINVFDKFHLSEAPKVIATPYPGAFYRKILDDGKIKLFKRFNTTKIYYYPKNKPKIIYDISEYEYLIDVFTELQLRNKPEIIAAPYPGVFYRKILDDGKIKLFKRFNTTKIYFYPKYSQIHITNITNE
jgi:hypothetical protein